MVFRAPEDKEDSRLAAISNIFTISMNCVYDTFKSYNSQIVF